MTRKRRNGRTVERMYDKTENNARKGTLLKKRWTEEEQI